MGAIQGVSNAATRVMGKVREWTEPQPVVAHTPEHGDIIFVRTSDTETLPVPTDRIVSVTDQALVVQTPQGQVELPRDGIVSTAGDLPHSSPGRAAGSGAIQGAFATGLSAATLSGASWVPGLLGGLAGGYAGVKEGEQSHSLAKALETGAAVGAGTTMLAAAGLGTLAAVLGPVTFLLPVASMGLLVASGRQKGSKPSRLLDNPVMRPVTRVFDKLATVVAKVDKALHGHLGLAAGIAAGATALALAPAAIPLAALGTLGALGGLAGAAGTLSGNRLSSLRDREVQGFMTGAVARAFAPLPGVSLASGVGAAIGAAGSTPARRAAAAFGASFVIGAGTGLIAGPQAAVASGVLSGIAGATATLAGPRMMQAVRNLSGPALTHALDRLAGSKLQHLGTGGRLALGMAGGALMGGAMGLVAAPLYGPLALAVPAVAGAAFVASKVLEARKQAAAPPAPAAPSAPTAVPESREQPAATLVPSQPTR